MKIKCKFFKPVYQKDQFIIAIYKAINPIETPLKTGELYFTAKGINLPSARKVTYVLDGQWITSAKDGKRRCTFEVNSFEEELPKESAGIIKYLQTLDGVGKITAILLYEKFGNDIFDVLDNDIEQIQNVKGIRKATFRKIKTCWTQKSVGKELFAFLFKFKVPNNVIMKIFETYEEFALDMLKQNPYAFIEFPGFGFFTADAIAKDMCIENEEDPNSYLNRTERIKAGILEVIKEYEIGGPLIRSYSTKYHIPISTGNTCIAWPELYSLVCELLNLNTSAEDICRVINLMKDREIIISDNNYFFRRESGRKEMGVAKKVTTMLQSNERFSLNLTKSELDFLLTQAIAKNVLDVKLSDEQTCAVLTALNNRLAIITGGPGTGKTSIIKAIIYALEDKLYDPEILLVAPTGRAARRMAESTGYPARTIHSALGLYANESEHNMTIEKLSADVVIIDEASMIDLSLASYLFSAINDHTRVVIVGDDKQLPSVGPGCVLRELIECKEVPVATLTAVFRQAKGSSISYNAKRIIAGNPNILEDDTFSLIEVDGTDNIAEKVKELYKEYVDEYGINEVTILSPYRQKTNTGVDSLNIALQRLMFPDKKPEAADLFMTGDKVMYTKNSNGLTNGELGIITAINNVDGEPAITCEFSGEIVTLEDEDIRNLDLAYATTIHKSQGSEYKVVIIVMDPVHGIMHKRNLIYTAVTRAKRKCIVVGSKKSYLKSISAEETNVRLSRLGDYIYKYRHPETESASAEEDLQISFDV